MNKEKIEKRIEELLKSKEQFLANANACEGAIIELKLLLKEEEEEKEVEVKK